MDKASRREQNRLEKARIQGAAKAVLISLRPVLATLKRERRRLAKAIHDHSNRHARLQHDRALLETLAGIGKVLSVELLAMLRSRDFKGAGQSAALAAVVPIAQRSGSSIDRPARLSQTGAPNSTGARPLPYNITRWCASNTGACGPAAKAQ